MSVKGVPGGTWIRFWTPKSHLGGHFKNAFELLNLRAIKIQCCIKVWVKYFVWNFKGYLWNSTQNIIPIHWKMWILFTGENLRALRFKSSYVFLKRHSETLSLGANYFFRPKQKSSILVQMQVHHNCLLKEAVFLVGRFTVKSLI